MSKIYGLSDYVVTCSQCGYKETWLGEKAAFNDAQYHWFMMSHVDDVEHETDYNEITLEKEQ